MLILKRPWKEGYAPLYAGRVNSTHPISAGLKLAVVPRGGRFLDLLSQEWATPGASTRPGWTGRGWTGPATPAASTRPGWTGRGWTGPATPGSVMRISMYRAFTPGALTGCVNVMPAFLPGRIALAQASFTANLGSAKSTRIHQRVCGQMDTCRLQERISIAAKPFYQIRWSRRLELFRGKEFA